MKGNIINWNEFQQGALTTAIYPLKRELEYTILGLCSEVGEIGEVYGREKLMGWGFTRKGTNEILAEIGDNWWYAAAVADALGKQFEEVRTFSGLLPENYRSRGLTILTLQKHASKIAGVLKKSIRDNDGYFEAKHTDAVMAELFQFTHQLENLTEQFGSTTEAVMAKNLNKLADRKARGVLQGSGDNR